MRLPIHERAIPMWHRHHARSGPDLAADQPEAGGGGGVHRDHRVHQHTIGIALLHRTKAAPALRRGREFNLRGILDRQHMPPGAGGPGLRTPSFDDLRYRHLSVGEEPAGPLFASAVPTEAAQAHGLAHDHLFEDRTPPLSRRRSPNVPSDISMAAPVRRLPQGSESYSGRVGQAENSETFRLQHYMCACPSAFAGGRLWAGLCPGQNESAGKRKSSRLRKGAPWLKTMLVQCAWAAKRQKNSYYAAQFHRLKSRRGPQKAICAVAASILTAVYHMLNDGTSDQDLGADYFDRRSPEAKARRLVAQLSRLGFEVQLQPLAQAA
jgi:hypothetical protein